MNRALVGALSGPEMTGQVAFGGAEGHRIDLTLDPVFKDGHSTNLPPPTDPPSYKLVFVLKRPGIPLLGEYEVKAPELLAGDSYFAVRPPATDKANIDSLEIRWLSDQKHQLILTARPNEAGFLGRIDTQLQAPSAEEANHLAHSVISSVLSYWSLHTDVPVEIFQSSCTALSTGQITTSFRHPFSPRPIMSSQAQTGEEFRAYASLYREALNSNSPPYQFLCLFKILEATTYRRASNKQSVARTNPDLVLSSERLPKEDSECEPWLRRIYAVRPVWHPMEFGILFPSEMRGQKFTRVFQERLGPARKAIAHALSEKGEIHLSADLLLHNRAVDLWLPLTKLMARRMLKNEFPQEFLVGLGEG